MDEFIKNSLKFLSSTVIVRIVSYPNFSIEILLACIVVIAQSLLYFDVCTVASRINVKLNTRLKSRQPTKESSDTCSFHSLVTLKTTQVFHKKPEVYCRTPIYPPIDTVQRRFSRINNIGWSWSKGDSIMKPKFMDRVEHLLSITPSEYVRRDKERKSREQGLRSCLQSLTSVLEKALNNDGSELQHASKQDIKKSLNTLRENFENHLGDDDMKDMPSPSIHSIIEQSVAQRALKSSLCPDQLMTAIYRASNMNFVTRKDKERENIALCRDDYSLKSSGSLNELFSKRSLQLSEDEKRNSCTLLI